MHTDLECFYCYQKHGFDVNQSQKNASIMVRESPGELSQRYKNWSVSTFWSMTIYPLLFFGWKSEMPSAKVRTVSSWSGNKERRDQQSQREDTKNTYFLGPCCVLWYSTTSPVVKGVAEEVWAGRGPRIHPPLPEQTILFGTYTGKIQAREAYRTFLFVCTKNITTGRAGDIFLMQVFVCMVNCLKKGGAWWMGGIGGSLRRWVDVRALGGSEGMPFTLHPAAFGQHWSVWRWCLCARLFCFHAFQPPRHHFFSHVKRYKTKRNCFLLNDPFLAPCFLSSWVEAHRLVFFPLKKYIWNAKPFKKVQSNSHPWLLLQPFRTFFCSLFSVSVSFFSWGQDERWQYPAQIGLYRSWAIDITWLSWNVTFETAADVTRHQCNELFRHTSIKDSNWWVRFF